MNKKYLLLVGVLIAVLVAVALNRGNLIGATKKYNTELDSIFYGIKFGMPRQEFYDRCWQLNKEKDMVQGSQNASVLYINSVDFKLPVNMNFYPNFCEDIICKMPVFFNYIAWSPWNRECQSDYLVKEVKSLMEKWYGTGFKEKIVNGKLSGYYKEDLPRQIIIKIRDEQYVDVLIENYKYIKYNNEK